MLNSGISNPSEEILKETSSEIGSVPGMRKKDSSISIKPLSRRVVSTLIINVWEDESILIWLSPLISATL